jgi:uncharacterized membrane protein
MINPWLDTIVLWIHILAAASWVGTSFSTTSAASACVDSPNAAPDHVRT